MKKIAMLTDGWKRMITYAWINGIAQRGGELGEDICIHQYNCYGNWRKDKKYNEGEYNIFRLPDLSQYDAVILDCNFMSDKEQLQELTLMLQKVTIPVISIGYAMDNCYYVGIDNTTPIKEMMKHLLYVHGCTRFLYAGGPLGNYENYARMKAFRDFLSENGLTKDEHPVWFGDYEYDTGVQYMNRLVEENQPLPDAVVCANDNIAAGICARAEELGYHVPDDFIVTGFDNMDKAAYFYPQITTADNNRERIAAATLDILQDIWSGKKVEIFNFVPARCILGESCGCKNSGAVNYRKYIKEQIIEASRAQKEDEHRVVMEGRMAECTDYYGIFHEMAEFLTALDCDGFYVVMDQRLLDGPDECCFSIHGYQREELMVAYAVEQRKELKLTRVEELEAHIDNGKAGDSYMYTPLHFRQYTVGYTIVKNPRFLRYDPYFYDIQSTCVRAMEAMFKQIQVEKANQRLAEIYNRDPMTGLYNRMAYTEMIGPAYEKYQEQGVACCLAFFDVNDFKELNDTMGHEYGDTLLKRIAKVLLRLQPDGGYAYRFGGDEFVVFFPYATASMAEQYRIAFLEEMRKIGVFVSIGMVLTNPKEEKTLDEYLVQADIRMYDMKKAEKEKR